MSRTSFKRSELQLAEWATTDEYRSIKEVERVERMSYLAEQAEYRAQYMEDREAERLRWHDDMTRNYLEWRERKEARVWEKNRPDVGLRGRRGEGDAGGQRDRERVQPLATPHASLS